MPGGSFGPDGSKPPIPPNSPPAGASDGRGERPLPDVEPGEPPGPVDGLGVGCFEGEADGLDDPDVGRGVGFEVGFGVGTGVGLGVGLGVGTGVGLGVGDGGSVITIVPGPVMLAVRVPPPVPDWASNR
jgi:hypothetical protein